MRIAKKSIPGVHGDGVEGQYREGGEEGEMRKILEIEVDEEAWALLEEHLDGYTEDHLKRLDA